jgi:carbonic anhydrase/acetyltransferase-like protein (isoleucine patch superfamily)
VAAEHAPENLRSNVATSFNPDVESPVIGAGSYIDKLASVLGNVQVGKNVFVAPFASIRGDEGQPLFIGDGSNVQDGVVVHGLETLKDGQPVEKNLVTVGAKKYAVYIGKNVSLAHQSQVHGPAWVGDNTFVGMQALVFKATIGKNVVVEPGAKVIGVTVPEKRYVPAGSVITTQAQADALPEITPSYPFATLNDGVLHVNEEFAEAYLAGAGGNAGEGGGH